MTVGRGAALLGVAVAYGYRSGTEAKPLGVKVGVDGTGQVFEHAVQRCRGPSRKARSTATSSACVVTHSSYPVTSRSLSHSNGGDGAGRCTAATLLDWFSRAVERFVLRSGTYRLAEPALLGVAVAPLGESVAVALGLLAVTRLAARRAFDGAVDAH